jgi:hypothetical protein
VAAPALALGVGVIAAGGSSVVAAVGVCAAEVSEEQAATTNANVSASKENHFHFIVQTLSEIQYGTFYPTRGAKASASAGGSATGGR